MSRRNLLRAGLAMAVFAAAACYVTLRTPVPLSAEARLRPAPTLALPAEIPPLGSWQVFDTLPSQRFVRPVAAVVDPEDPDWLFVLELRGQLFRLKRDGTERQLVLSLVDRVLGGGNGENGALNLTFHPAHGRHYLFLYHTVKSDGVGFQADRLSRFTWNDSSGLFDTDSEQVLINLKDDHKQHNGGGLAFGPDNFLYLALGDEGDVGGILENDQKIDRDLFSGILRIDVDMRGGEISHPPPRMPDGGKTQHYYIPNDNPFVGMANALEEFWAIGFRNPHRMAFDNATNKLWVGEVGQRTIEEIEVPERGTNHQWSYREGTLPYAEGRFKGQRPTPFYGTEKSPIYQYRHGAMGRCIIGGFVYRGERHAKLTGQYIFGDFVTGKIFAVDTSQQPIQGHLELISSGPSASLVSFTSAPDGEIYVIYRGTGKEDGYLGSLREAVGEKSPKIPERLSMTGVFKDLPSLEPAPGILPYTVNSPQFLDGANARRWLALPADGQLGLKAEGQWLVPPGTVAVQHLERNGRRLETRLLVATAGGAYPAIYQWNEAGTDAQLTPEADSKCLQCHNPGAGTFLGLNSRQLNRSIRHPALPYPENQIRLLHALGLVNKPFPLHRQLRTPSLAGLEGDAPAAAKARAYLDTNCAPCHYMEGPTGMEFDASFAHFSDPANLVDGLPLNPRGIAGAKIIKSGDPQGSIAFLRIASAEPGIRMPPVDRETVDEKAVETLRTWIESL